MILVVFPIGECLWRMGLMVLESLGGGVWGCSWGSSWESSRGEEALSRGALQGMSFQSAVMSSEGCKGDDVIDDVIK